MRMFSEMVESATRSALVDVAVVGKVDAEMVRCFNEARARNIGRAVFFAPPCEMPPEDEIPGRVVRCESDEDASAKAVRATRSGECSILMKGIVHTDVFLRSVFSRETGLLGNRLVSNVFVYERPGIGFCLLTDPSINVAPTLEQKAQIIENAVELARSLGITRPKVAVLCAVETVTSKMPETLEAAALSKMAERGQIQNCMVDGPLALDNALSLESVKTKGIESEVAGRADVLVCNRIAEANILSKALPLFAGMELAASVVGTTRPTIIVSRADGAKSRLLSLCLSKHMVSH